MTFFIGIGIGFLIPGSTNIEGSSIFLSTRMTGLQGFTNILLNNAKSGLLIILLGWLSFGLYSIVQLLVNGMVLTAAIRFSPYSLAHTFALVVPHGFVEIPAIILSGAIGLLTFFWLTDIFSKNQKTNTTKKNYAYLAKVFFINMIMYFLSALIEAFLTPVIGDVF